MKHIFHNLLEKLFDSFIWSVEYRTYVQQFWSIEHKILVDHISVDFSGYCVILLSVCDKKVWSNWTPEL